MNMMIYPLGCFAFYVYGFALGWGNWWNGPVPPGWYPSLGPGLSILNEGWGIGGDPSAPGVFKYGIFGTKGLCLSGIEDVSVLALFFFQMVFFDTTATIPTGAMAERWSWKNFCLYGFWVALPYCLYANWVWGGGWLAQMGKNWNLGHGAVDFAGSGVVHAMGGVIGLGGAIVLGPRIGKYGPDGKPRAIPGHNIPLAILGTFILAFGWFGFNPGSTLSGTDLRISAVVVNTLLASATGAMATMFFLMGTGKKPDPSMMLNGMLAGLVAITAPCAFVDTWAACVIGAVAGVLVVLSVNFFDSIGVDDPVGAISVHGANGLWGVISVGIFATGKYGAGWNGVVRDEWVQGRPGIRRRSRHPLRRRQPAHGPAARCRDGCRVWLRHGFCLVQDQQRDHADPSQPRNRNRRTRWSGNGSAWLQRFVMDARVDCLNQWMINRHSRIKTVRN